MACGERLRKTQPELLSFVDVLQGRLQIDHPRKSGAAFGDIDVAGFASEGMSSNR
jgi:hypothetical protein